MPGHTPKHATSCYEALEPLMESGQRIFVHSAAATPTPLVEAMARVAKDKDLEGIEVCNIHTEGPAPHAAPGMEKHFRTRNFFTGANQRKAIAEGRSDYVPIFLSEIPLLFKRGIMPVDIALVQVSPPDKFGYCSLGVSVDVARAAVQCSRFLVAQYNPRMPRTFGDGQIHNSHFDAVVEHAMELPELSPPPPSEVQKQIGQHIADNLVKDGATLQMGIGSIPDAVLSQLGGHRRLSIWSEMFSDGILPLVESGVVTNDLKGQHTGKILTSFAIGTRKLYDFLDDNPSVLFKSSDYSNDTGLIRQQPNMTAINSCIELDLTGNIVSDSIGSRIYSGVGGQVDFLRGAALANGTPILALPSRTSRGDSRIVPTIKPGAGVVTTRAHVHYVVTEYGIAHLFGKSIRERARALIDIAHPEDREGLEQAAKDILHVSI